MKAIISLGSNLGDRRSYLKSACSALAGLCNTELLRCSSLYETAPFGVEDEQPDYLNQLVELETRLSPAALLGACLGIEAALGRERPAGAVKAARVIDIDLLLAVEGGKAIYVDTPELELPHPRMLERAFVLVPLAELYPSFNCMQIDFSAEYGKLDKSGVRPV